LWGALFKSCKRFWLSCSVLWFW
jgi:hypothetical protein